MVNRKNAAIPKIILLSINDLRVAAPDAIKVNALTWTMRTAPAEAEKIVNGDAVAFCYFSAEGKVKI
jgi:hypothetical protein